MDKEKRKQKIVTFAPGQYVIDKIEALAVKWGTNTSETIRYAINEAHQREFPKVDQN